MQFSTSTIALLALLPAFGLAAPAFGFDGHGQAKANGGDKGAAAGAGAGADAGAGAGAGAGGNAGQAKAPKSTNAAASSTLASMQAVATGYGAKAAAAVPKMTPSDAQIANAVNSWMADTGKVTKFLNTATGLTGDDFTTQATIAFNAEVDELNHKMILDAALGNQASVKAANDTLVAKGAFQTVVDDLNTMAKEGPDTAQQVVDKINANRCVNVLPNIDAYFAAAGSPTVKSVRPTGCLEVPGSNFNVQDLNAQTKSLAAAQGNAAAPAQTSAAVVDNSAASNGTAAAVDSASSSASSSATKAGKAADKTAAAKAAGGAAKETAAAKADAASSKNQDAAGQASY